MKRSKRSFAVVSALFAVLLSLSAGTLNARDADLASLTLATERTNAMEILGGFAGAELLLFDIATSGSRRPV